MAKVIHDYRIFTSLHSDLNSSHVWMSHAPKSKYVRIKHNNKSVVVQRKGIDLNFRKVYNQNNRTYNIQKSQASIILSNHYRKKLDVDKNSLCELEIETVDLLGGLLHTTLSSPNPREKFIFVGFIGIIISFLLWIYSRIFN